MVAMTDKTSADSKTTDTAVPPLAQSIPAQSTVEPAAPDAEAGAKGPEQMPGEIGGPKGPEPTRYGDWEFKGRCSDF